MAFQRRDVEPFFDYLALRAVHMTPTIFTTTLSVAPVAPAVV